MGFICHRGRIQTRIHTESSSIRDKRDLSPEQKFKYFKSRSGRFIKKRCYRNSSVQREKLRFLQHLLFGSEKERKNETSNKSETPKQVSEERTFQNGHFDQGSQSSKAKRLGNLSRSQRCISAHSNFCKAQAVPSVLHRRPVLPMEMSLLRPYNSTEGVYKDNFCSSSSLKSTKHQTSVLSGRLASFKPVKKVAFSRSRENAESFDFSRFHNQIRSRPQTGNSLHRGNVSFPFGNSDSNSRKNRETCNGSEQIVQRSKSGQRFSPSVRLNGFMSRIDSQCPSVHATHSATSISFLETLINESRDVNPCYTSSKITSSMVVKSSKHFEGSIFTTGSHAYDSNHRCISTGLRGSCGQKCYSGVMVRRPTETAHKSSGVGSSIPYNKTFSSDSEKQKCSDKERLNYSSSVYKQARWHEITSPMLQDLGSLEFCNSEQHLHQSSSHFRGPEHSGGSVVKSSNQTHRVDASQVSGSENFSCMGRTSDRSVCVSTEQTDADILLLDSSPRSSSSGRIDNLMGEHVRICVSANLSHSQSPETYGAVSLPTDSHSSQMATQTLVHRSSTNVNCMSKETATVVKSTTAAKHNDQTSKSRGIQSSCLASIDRSFQEKGFSCESRKLLSASWRQGTQKDYSGKFNKFSSWCSSREINPYSTSLTQVADFLTYLFDKGLQYRTIAGYRSMLSAILPNVDNVPVGQHPHIIRLLKGVFNSRPPKVRLLPEWDLQLVLNMLQKEPFEPLSKASLKITTFKTIFLMAISTFRRCGDLQSLRPGEGSVCVQKKGVTFIRHGLAKQDRVNHFGSKIFVPAFAENHRLDPKRALYWYLKQTKVLRIKLDGTQEKKIFLALNKPHQPVSTQTISNWIVQTIKMAYEDKSVKVKAHSTRAIGPSWALYKGASMKSILDVADWSKETTFTKFYLRNIDVEVLKQ